MSLELPGCICGRDRKTLLRLTEIFNAPARHLEQFADHVLDQIFWDLGVDAFPAVNDSAIAWTDRHRFIRSFEVLFRDFFAKRCQNVLGHKSESGSALNLSCYMWWDFDCWRATPTALHSNPLDEAFLSSMRSILTIDHIACQESALHGLGHWHHAHGPEVEAIIDEFLEVRHDLPAALRLYANNARCGCVL